MKPLSRTIDGLRYSGTCESNGLFKKTAVHCPNCSAPLAPQALPEMGGAAYLVCSQPRGGCTTPVKSFASEDEMNQYLDNNWAVMEDACYKQRVK